MIVTLILAALTFLCGVVGRLGTTGFSVLDANGASAFGLIVLFTGLMIFFSTSDSPLFPLEVFSGLPFVNEISDYGSLHALLQQNFSAAVQPFLDLVLLNILMALVELIPLSNPGYRRWDFVNILAGFVTALIAMLIMNYIIKPSSVYRDIMDVVTAVVSIASVAGVPLLIYSRFSSRNVITAAVVVSFIAFSRNRLFGIIRSAILRSFVFLGLIYILEVRFGSIAASAASISQIIVAFAPSFIIIWAIVKLMRLLFAPAAK
ncbi:MAG: hypothetical protein ACI4V3_10550 [Faecousia sp.]